MIHENIKKERRYLQDREMLEKHKYYDHAQEVQYFDFHVLYSKQLG